MPPARVGHHEGMRDGFSAVKTTGVYCHAGCPARPKPENVVRYEAADEAERAGFRACKRCRPDRPIRWGVGRSALGALLVAVSPRGLCAVLLGDDAASLEADLRARFPMALLVRGDVSQSLAAVARTIEEPRASVREPLDAEGTPFQQRVWSTLRTIPVGETRSYAEVAARLGDASAVRAVARACGENPLAVVVPCHRVVRKGGGLSGYRWGVQRKQALLERELRA